MSKVKPVLSAFLCLTLILVCNLSMTYADPTTNNASTIFIEETIGTQENEVQDSITAVEAEENFVQSFDTSDQETESNSVSDSDTVEIISSPNQSDNSIDGLLSTPAYDVSAFSLASDVRSIDELDSLSLSLEYDDHYSIEKLEDNYSVAYIYNQSATSYQVSKGKKGNLDTSVIEKDGSSNKDIVATGVGTATLLLVPDSQINNVKSTINNIGSTEEAYILETLADKYYSQSFSNWLTVEVDVEPADLTLIYVAGQSNAEGWCSSSTGYQVQDSVLCEEGTVYSTYVPNDISKGSQIAGLDFSSADTNGSNASKFVAGSLTGETSISGNNLQYPLNSLTEAGDGKTGTDSGIAYQWNQLTGDKVWVVNAAWGGTSITKWVPGATCYKRANTIFDLATQTFDAEISSGHYKEASILMFWVQVEADADMDAGTYTSYFNTMYEKWMDSYDLDGFGIIMVRAAAGSHTTAADLKMTGPRIALYSIGRSDDYPNVFVVSNANEEWVSNSGVSSYFSSEYTGGTLSYPTHRSASKKIPTTVSEIHSDIHYSQIGHNENGITAAKGMYNALFQASSNITSAWKDQDYHTITSILMEEGDQVTVIPVAEPAYQAKKLRISVSGSAVKYDSETGLVSGVNLGIAKLQIKTSTGKVLSTLDVSVTEIPKISSIDNINTGVTIKWNTVSDAKNYTIYRHSGDGDLTEIATTSLTSYTDKTVKNGNTYYYRIGYTSNTGAEVSGVSSSYDKSITFLSSPELNAAYGENGGIVFNWKSVTGASEYRIYRKTGSTGWAMIGTSSSNSYKDSTAKIGSTYIYTVRAVKGSSVSGYDSAGLSVKYVGTPTINSITSTSSSITISWSAVSGAENYRVYRHSGDNELSIIETTTSTSFTDTDVKSGTTYYYRVRCANKAGTMSTSGFTTSYSSAACLSSPKLNAAYGENGGIVVNWKSVSGASSYRVYRKTTGSGWAQIGTTSSTSYKDTSAKVGTTYIYTVRAVKGSSVSGYDSSGISLKYVGTPTFSEVTADAYRVKLKWSSISGAEKYRIYRHSGDGDLTIITTTSSTSFTDTDVESGETYYYRVRCADKDGNMSTSGFSTTYSSITCLATPQLDSIHNETNGVVITWKSVEGAERYQIYRKTNGSSWALIGTSTSTSYRDSSAKSGTSYTYTVRAVKGTTQSWYNSSGLSVKRS